MYAVRYTCNVMRFTAMHSGIFLQDRIDSLLQIIESQKEIYFRHFTEFNLTFHKYSLLHKKWLKLFCIFVLQSYFFTTCCNISMGLCKKDITPLLTHWSYVFLALIPRYHKHQYTTPGLSRPSHVNGSESIPCITNYTSWCTAVIS